jgi:hypothetical protein
MKSQSTNVPRDSLYAKRAEASAVAQMKSDVEKEYEVVARPSLARALTGMPTPSNPSGSGADTKSGSFETMLAASNLNLRKTLAVLKTGSNKSGLSPTRTKLYYASTITGSAGAAITPVYPIVIGDLTEVVSAWAELYDECKLHGGRVMFRVRDAGADVVGKWGVVCYDPADDATLTTLLGGLEHSQKKLFGFGRSTDSQVTPVPVNKDGFYSFPFTTKGVRAIETLPAAGIPFNAPGLWHDLRASSSTTGCADGSIKYHLEGSSNNTLSLEQIIELDISFRSRS